MKKKILMSAYSCNPYGVSESLAAFNFLNILLKKFNIVLLTTKENQRNIEKFYTDKPRTDLIIIPFRDKYLFKNNKLIHESLKLGYFIFNHKIYRYLKKNNEIISQVDLLYHKSPSGFRYFSLLYKFDKPFVFGPTGGGLHPPKVLKEYFKKEHNIFKLRKLDSFILNTPLYKKHYQSTKKILITLPYVKEIIGTKFNNKYVTLFDTGIDTKKHSPIPDSNKKYPISIIYVGKLTRYKGAELLVRAIEKVETPIPYIVDIYGDGEERLFLENLTKSLRLNDKVKFHGYVDHNEMQTIYSQASIFCFPTITEASGNALLEAMSYSLPIITINNGGPKYMCPDQGTIKIDIDTIDNMINSLAASIKSLLVENEKRIQMGAINRKHCVENYDWEIIEQKTLTFFSEILYND